MTEDEAFELGTKHASVKCVLTCKPGNSPYDCLVVNAAPYNWGVELPTGPTLFFDRHIEACAFQRGWRMAHLLDPFTGKPSAFLHWQRWHNSQAVSEGWLLAYADGRGVVEIERDDSQDTWPTDDHALAYVQKRAIEGSTYHQYALDIVAMQERQED